MSDPLRSAAGGAAPAHVALRINAFLAAAGLGSRRAVEELVKQERVSLNGTTLVNLSARIDPERDTVTVDGRRITSKEHEYVAMHKPRGFACTRSDPHIEKTIYDLMPRNMWHLVHAGRLDVDSEGLLLLSNDGQWVHGVTHPRVAPPKTYLVEVKGAPTAEALASARRGVVNEGERLRVEVAEMIGGGRTHATLRVVLREGKNREIRRIFNSLQHPVLRLKRIRIGALALGDLGLGSWRHLTPREVAALRDGAEPSPHFKSRPPLGITLRPPPTSFRPRPPHLNFKPRLPLGTASRPPPASFRPTLPARTTSRPPPAHFKSGPPPRTAPKHPFANFKPRPASRTTPRSPHESKNQARPLGRRFHRERPASSGSGQGCRDGRRHR